MVTNTLVVGRDVKDAKPALSRDHIFCLKSRSHSSQTQSHEVRGGSTGGGRSPPLAANFLNPVREFSVTFCLLSKAHIKIHVSRFSPPIRLFCTYTECNMSAYFRKLTWEIHQLAHQLSSESTLVLIF